MRLKTTTKTTNKQKLPGKCDPARRDHRPERHRSGGHTDVGIRTKNYKMAVMNMFKLEKIIKMNEKMWNLSREMETIKKHQMEFPELGNTIVLDGKHH